MRSLRFSFTSMDRKVDDYFPSDKSSRVWPTHLPAVDKEPFFKSRNAIDADRFWSRHVAIFQSSKCKVNEETHHGEREGFVITQSISFFFFLFLSLL